MNRKEKGELLLRSFPPLPEDIVRSLHAQLKHFLLFSADVAECTACGWHGGREERIALNPVHNAPITCPGCKRTLIAMKSYCRYSSAIRRSASNFAIFRTLDGIVYVHCVRVESYFDRIQDGKAVYCTRYQEDQRYAFADGLAYRFGKDVHWGYTEQKRYELLRSDWKLRTRYTEPIFDPATRGGSRYGDNSYIAVGLDTLKDSCLKYAEAEQFHGAKLFEYLQYYLRHPQVEYLMKIGFSEWVSKWFGGYSKGAPVWIDWKQNDVRKMLRMDSYELRRIRETASDPELYYDTRKYHGDFSVDELLRYAPMISRQEGTLERVCAATKQSPKEVLKYLYNQNKKYDKEVRLYDYQDYLRECKELKYDLSYHTVVMPKCLLEAHRRTSEICNMLERQRQIKAAEQRRAEQRKRAEALDKKKDPLKKQREKLHFEQNGLLIRPPKSLLEIVDEGAVLGHCVGGYAERHGNGRLHILFIRTIDKPDVPYYTMELDLDGNIRQVRGYHNQATTPQVDEFVAAYKEYLASIYKKKTKVRKTA